MTWNPWKRIRELERKLADAEAFMTCINNGHATENYRLRKRIQDLESQNVMRLMNDAIISNQGRRT